MVADKVYDIMYAVPEMQTWNLHIGDLPSAEKECTCIIEYDGYSSTEYFKSAEIPTSIVNPVVKIITRTASYVTGQARNQQIKELLHRYHDEDLLSVLLVGAPMYLGRGDMKLHEFQVTFQIQTKE